MLKSFRWSMLSAVLVLGVSAVAFAQETATVTVQNNSSFAIAMWHMSPVDQNAWGPDQLGAEVIAAGGSFQLTDVPCDLYDVKLIDEDGDECVVAGVAICDEDAVWELTDEALIGCQVGTAVDGAVEGE